MSIIHYTVPTLLSLVCNCRIHLTESLAVVNVKPQFFNSDIFTLLK